MPVARSLAVLSLAVLLAACSSPDERGAPLDQAAPADADAAAADSAPIDAAPGDAEAGDAGAPDRIRAAATNGAISLPFTVDIAGAGSGVVGEVAIGGGTGTVVVKGAKLPALVYERQPFGEYVLYQALAVAADRWYVLWAYCRGPQLSYVYYEGTDGTAIAYEPASGTCAESESPSAPSIAFPALDMPIPPLLQGFEVTGPDVDIRDGAPGELRLGGPPLTVLPFDSVDCTQDCGTPGWREIHALLWDRKRERACFGIFYLFDQATPVLLTYSLTLPDLSDPAGRLELAGTTWTAP